MSANEDGTTQSGAQECCVERGHLLPVALDCWAGSAGGFYWQVKITR